jgi:hypothetical protein
MRISVTLFAPHRISVQWEFSLFGFCLSFAKTKCAKFAIAKTPYEGGEKEVVRWLLLWLPAKKCVGKNFKIIFYWNVLVETKELLCVSLCEKSPVEVKCFLSTRNCLRRMSAPMRYNVFGPCVVGLSKHQQSLPKMFV